jgi:hypothetical protein
MAAIGAAVVAALAGSVGSSGANGVISVAGTEINTMMIASHSAATFWNFLFMLWCSSQILCSGWKRCSINRSLYYVARDCKGG